MSLFAKEPLIIEPNAAYRAYERTCIYVFIYHMLYRSTYAIWQNDTR